MKPERAVKVLPWITCMLAAIPSVWQFVVRPVVNDLDEWGKGLGEALYIGIPFYLSWILPLGYGVGWLIRHWILKRRSVRADSPTS